MMLRGAAVTNSSEFGLTGAVVPVNSTPAQNMNYSQRVDLDGLNLSMTHALMPTILFLVLIMVVGVVGNTVVLLVYYRRFKPSSIRTYILSMSVCDVLASVISLPAEILNNRYYFTYNLPFVCKSHRALNVFLVSTSAFILVAVATDRFAKVCRQKHLSMRRIHISVLICALFALAVSFFRAVFAGSRTIHTGVRNTTTVTCSLISDAYRHTLFPLVFYVIGTLIFFLCVLIIVVSYIRIALELRRHKQRQTHTSGVVPIITIAPADRHCQTAIPDNASGPVLDLEHFETCLSDPEPISQKSVQTANKTVTASFATLSSDKHMQVSFKSFTLQQHDLSDTDDAGCSVQNMGTLSASPIVCKKGNNTCDDIDKSTTIQRIPLSATSSTDDVTSIQAMTSNALEVITSQDTNAQEESFNLHSTQPAANTCTTLQGNIISRSRSLLRRLRAPRTRRDWVQRGRKTPLHSVKAIPSSTTAMMFVLAVVFIINNVPSFIVIILLSTSNIFDQGLTAAKRNLYHIGLMFPLVNCAANCIVYGFCNPRFRHECHRFFARDR